MIDQQESLDALVARLKSADWIALDTEADSLHAYPERLCLLQISIPGHDELVDPLSGLDFAPLWKVFCEHELLMHGADYDLRLLRRAFQFKPTRLFDTMLAARLLGYTEFSLSHLVARHLGVKLEKGPQKMDWGRRPLTERMRQYALNDTRNLRSLVDVLKSELREKNRLGWAEESCARLIQDTAREKEVDLDSVWRLKGADRLTPRAACILRELWRWRESEAVKVNRPPFFVLSHDSLVTMAARVAHRAGVEGQIPLRILGRRKASLEAALKKALEIPPSSFPGPLPRTGVRLTGPEQARVGELRLRRDKRADELGLDPALIASRATLAALARGEAGAVADLMEWQREQLGLEMS